MHFAAIECNLQNRRYWSRVLFILLFASLQLYRRAVAKDCILAKEQCDNSDECLLALEAMKVTCSVDTAGRCNITEHYKKYCRSILRTVMSASYGFRDCTCNNMDSSTFEKCIQTQKRFNQHPCLHTCGMDSGMVIKGSDIRNVGGGTTKSTTYTSTPAFDYENGPTALSESLNELGISEDSGIGPSCYKAQQRCMDRRACRTEIPKFLKFCQLAICSKSISDCSNSYEILRYHNYFNCTCVNESKKNMASCRSIFWNFTASRCIHNSDNQLHTNKVKENGTFAPSCTSVYAQCMGDSECTHDVVYKLSNCTPSRPGEPAAACLHPDRCRAELRYFYNHLNPRNIDAAACQCRAGDEECEKRRLIFQPTCARQSPPTAPMPTCIDVVKTCYADRGCLARFFAYQKECWPGSFPTERCRHSPQRCHGSRYLVWSTQLLTKCHCHIQDNNARTLCLYIKKLIDEPICLSNISAQLPATPMASATQQSLAERVCARARPYNVGRLVLYRNSSSRYPDHRIRQRPDGRPESCSVVCECTASNRRNGSSSGSGSSRQIVVDRDFRGGSDRVSWCGPEVCRYLSSGGGGGRESPGPGIGVASPCHALLRRRRPELRSLGCRCDAGGTAWCRQSPYSAFKPGLYLHLAYDADEKLSLENRQPPRPSFTSDSIIATLQRKLPDSGTETSHCAFSMEEARRLDPSAAPAALLIRVRLKPERVRRLRYYYYRNRNISRFDTLLNTCEQPVTFVKRIIDSRLPEIQFEPQLSVITSATVLIVNPRPAESALVHRPNVKRANMDTSASRSCVVSLPTLLLVIIVSSTLTFDVR